MATKVEEEGLEARRGKLEEGRGRTEDVTWSNVLDFPSQPLDPLALRLNSGHGRRRHPDPSLTVVTDVSETRFTRQRVSDVATGRGRSAVAETWMDSDSEQSLNIGTCPDSQGDQPSLGR